MAYVARFHAGRISSFQLLCRRISRISRSSQSSLSRSFHWNLWSTGHEIEARALLAWSTSFRIFILSDRFAAEADGNRFRSLAAFEICLDVEWE